MSFTRKGYQKCQFSIPAGVWAVKKKMRAKEVSKNLCQHIFALMLTSTSIFGFEIGLENDSSKSSLNAKVTAW